MSNFIKILFNFSGLLLAASIAFIGCKDALNKRHVPENLSTNTSSASETSRSVEFLDPSLHELISADAQIEVIAEGFQWTEGPLWVEDGQYLLFSEIPSNSIYKWSEEDGAQLYLRPSGYTGMVKRGGEPGSNGLLLNRKGELILCQHGDRRIAKMNAPLSQPIASFETIADDYNGMRFNSPNDAVFDRDGNLYFTDPPYGLEGNASDPAKEMSFQGVFRLDVDGSLALIAEDIYRPNGIGISPDERTLYVASSEGTPMWTKFDLDDFGMPTSQEVFYHSESPSGQGAPDGLVVDKSGNIWATGPGGVWIFDQNAKLLGRVLTGEATSNCTFDSLEQVLYMTCDDYVMRIKLQP